MLSTVLEVLFLHVAREAGCRCGESILSAGVRGSAQIALCHHAHGYQASHRATREFLAYINVEVDACDRRNTSII